MCNLLDMRSDADENPWSQGFAIIKHSLKLERDSAPHDGEFRIMLVVLYGWPVLLIHQDSESLFLIWDFVGEERVKMI